MQVLLTVFLEVGEPTSGNRTKFSVGRGNCQVLSFIPEERDGEEMAGAQT